jgi:hypothetical protein
MNRSANCGTIVLAVLAWFVLGAADVRADHLYATHYSVWGQSEITELDPQTGTALNSFAPPSTPNQNAGLACDGTSLYFLSNNSTYNTVSRLDPSTGAVLGQYTLPDNSTRTGLTVLGSNLYDLDWNPNHNYIEIYDLATGSPKGSINFRAANPTASNLMLDGDLGTLRDSNLLLAVAHPVGSYTPTNVVELDPVTGVIQRQFAINDADANRAAKGVDAIGQEIFLSLHVAYSSPNFNEVIVYDQNGVEQRRYGVSGSTGVQALAVGPATVPEPSTLGLLAAGASAVIGFVWRRRKAV